MQIKNHRLKIAISALYEEGASAYYSGGFTSLSENIRSIAFQAPQALSTTINVGQLDKRLHIVHMDLLNLATISIRLILQQNLRGEKCEYRIGDELWRFFGSADIDLFFSKYRSIFDNITRVIGTTTRTPRNIPSSFNDLKTWVEKPENRPVIDEKYVKLVQSCDWFDHIRNVRDSIEHNAAETVVDYNKDKILFNISTLGVSLTHLPETSILIVPEITEDNGFLNFELYAGIYLGYLIWFLEELSDLIYQEFVPNKLDNQCRSYHPGFGTVRTWIGCAIKIQGLRESESSIKG